MIETIPVPPQSRNDLGEENHPQQSECIALEVSHVWLHPARVHGIRRDCGPLLRCPTDMAQDLRGR